MFLAWTVETGEENATYFCEFYVVRSPFVNHVYRMLCLMKKVVATITHYNIVSRAAQSNSVYVSVLKISIVHADSVSKSLHQNLFFSRQRPLLVRGKKLYFTKIVDTNRDLAHQSQNEDNFTTFSLKLEFLNEAEKEKNSGKRDSASASSRFASLSEGEMQKNFDRKTLW